MVVGSQFKTGFPFLYNKKVRQNDNICLTLIIYSDLPILYLKYLEENQVA